MARSLVAAAVIAVATDDTVREELHAAHLRLGGQTTRGLDLSMFGSEWVWMPTAAALNGLQA